MVGMTSDGQGQVQGAPGTGIVNGLMYGSPNGPLAQPFIKKIDKLGLRTLLPRSM